MEKMRTCIKITTVIHRYACGDIASMCTAFSPK